MPTPDEVRKNVAELLEKSDQELGEMFRSLLLSLPDATLGRMMRIRVAQMSAEQIQTSYEEGTLMCQLANKPPQDAN